VAIAAFGCGGHPPAPPKAKIVLAVMPAESDAFPGVATAATEALTKAQVKGVDETKVWKASLEVVQMQIECVTAEDGCFAAAGKELHADRLLFAQIQGVLDGAKKHRSIGVTVVLFDVGTGAAVGSGHEQFDTESAAIAGLPKLVAEATQK
jgi:hypothetical protein